MSYSPEHKARTRARILESAAKLFKTRGFEGAGIDAIMADAGLTRGGFYAHFKSKDDLLAEVLRNQSMVAALEAMKEQGIDDPAERWRRILDFYLSARHRDHPEIGCMIAALAGEVPRCGGDRSPRALADAIANGIAAASEHLARPGEPTAETRSRTLAVMSLMVGAVVASRATVGDRALSDEILEAAKTTAALLSGLDDSEQSKN